MTKEKISIIGAGSWGTTLAIILSSRGIDIDLCSVFPEHNLAMRRQRKNRLFLKTAKFPSSLRISNSLQEALSNEIIIIAIPAKYIYSVVKTIKSFKLNLKGRILVSVSKGIESKSFKRVSQILKQEFKGIKIAVLSGPNIASEVLKGVPSAAVLACKDKRLGKRLQVLFNSEKFRVYLHEDIPGVEIGGALKNVIALSCGISDGLGFGVNTKAALVTRGLAEITRLGVRLGAKRSTFWGISGLGDLTTTCFSSVSRNRSVGENIGKGRKIKDILKSMNMVAEGVETVKSAFKLSKKLKVDMPITREVYLVIYENKSPRRAVADLMCRPLKEEIG
ncbi:MAG: NAD(P)-dependent glycerol-3-phosphate dehydrogenase [Candidatus Omnitrophica bacterium]|nr:NAD(P)-dependent glycerol-3-phosphate dehydrogenase [Candidatus Omnitrophota bacterium]MDD5430171.1 NAD(P)-dependent glycerol-3-phosphate dehydrogenase [Candidatus Omnitrophota bacterium]